MSTTPVQVRALALVCSVIIDAVREAGSMGAPGGLICAGLMASGRTREQFQTLMRMLVDLGQLERRGELYFAVRA